MTKYKTFVIRLQVKVGSQEESLLEFLNDEDARPFSKPQMILLALKSFWLTLALLHQNESHSKVVASLNQGTYLWKLQEQYLQKLAGVETEDFLQQENREIKKVSSLSDSKTVGQTVFNPFGENVVSNF